MKLLDINQNVVNVDVRSSTYPIRPVSKSKLQGEVGEYLQEKFPRENILEEFTIPNSQLKCDFFLPNKGIVIEVQSDLHIKYVPHFHGPRANKGYAKQKSNDRLKAEWCEINGFNLIEIFSLEDLQKI
jgi:hypothetical protein